MAAIVGRLAPPPTFTIMGKSILNVVKDIAKVTKVKTTTKKAVVSAGDVVRSEDVTTFTYPIVGSATKLRDDTMERVETLFPGLEDEWIKFDGAAQAYLVDLHFFVLKKFEKDTPFQTVAAIVHEDRAIDLLRVEHYKAGSRLGKALHEHVTARQARAYAAATATATA